MERMQKILKDFVKHTKQVNGMTILQTDSKIRNLEFTGSEILVTKFNIGIHCKGPYRGAILQTNMDKKSNHLSKTS